MKPATLRLASAVAMVALSAFGCADLLGSLIGTPDASSEDTPTVSGPQVTTSADIADIHGFGTIVQNADRRLDHPTCQLLWYCGL